MPSSTNPNISVYSIVLTSSSCPTPHSCVFHSCTHCLAVFPPTLPISLTNAMSFDSIIWDSYHVCYSICSNIDFDYCFHCLLDLWSLLTSLWTSELQFLNYWKYSIFIINSTLLPIKAMLSSKLTSKLPDTDYGILRCMIVGWHSTWAEATVWTPSKSQLPVE